jgi:hypothetical protein
MNKPFQTLAFVAGVLVLAAAGLGEVAGRLGWSLGDSRTGGFPWGLLLIGTLLVAPRMLGTKVAGDVWQKVASMLPGKKE